MLVVGCWLLVVGCWLLVVVGCCWLLLVVSRRPLPLHSARPAFRLGPGHMWQLCKEFLLFLRQEKKWWLLPLVVVLLGLAVLILFSGSSALAPFMYPFM